MSTNTRMSFKVKTEYTVTENRIINLDRLLGKGGQEVVKSALAGLTNRTALMPGEAKGILNWQRVTDGEGGLHYRLQVPQEHLPQMEGLEGLSVHLRLRGPLTEVTHEAQFSHTETRTDTAAANVKSSPHTPPEVQRVVNRAVNQVLAYGFATHVTTKLKEQVKQKLNVQTEQRLDQLVKMRMSNRINIQTFARLRQ
jgi:hypothetical protein